jgi:pyrophosphatase PpaX
MTNWIFDLDGTLVDSFGHYFTSLEEVFSLHDKTFTPDLQHAALTDNLKDFFTLHLGEKALDPALLLLRSRSNHDATKIQAFPGIIDSLKNLRSSGAKIGVWTNRDYESANLILKHSGLENHVDAFVSGTCTKERKPYPEGLLRIANEFKSLPSEITMVGDHDHDVMAAKTAGARAIKASWHSYWEVKKCLIADHQFHELDLFHSFTRERQVPNNKSY